MINSVPDDNSPDMAEAPAFSQVPASRSLGSRLTQINNREQNFTLRELIEAELLQSMMSDFYAITRMPLALVDTQGAVLVGVGWQDICTKFHRVNPETCRNCVESDTQLTAGVPEGEYCVYKCKNNMWDVATPLIIDGVQLGSIFTGQFFFDDEPLDRATFESQAERYGFDKEAYLDALAQVPRFSREMIDRGMAFLTKLAHMVSQLGHKNMILARTLAEQKKSEEALIRSEKLASVGRMAATVAHEINNPLEAIGNCLFLANSCPELPSEIREYLCTAERELQRVAHMTKRTLGFYRENTKPANVELCTLVQEIVTLYSHKFRSKEIDLRLGPDKSSGIVTCVAGEIRQVISNLVTNAIDASQQHGRISIRIGSTTLNGIRYARLTVADRGTGIAPENRPHILKPFFTTKESTGTGLGLWVSDEIVRKHGGMVRMRTVEGRGTAFSILLPEAVTSTHMVRAHSA